MALKDLSMRTSWEQVSRMMLQAAPPIVVAIFVFDAIHDTLNSLCSGAWQQAGFRCRRADWKDGKIAKTNWAGSASLSTRESAMSTASARSGQAVVGIAAVLSASMTAA
jgi:hypothetical protein